MQRTQRLINTKILLGIRAAPKSAVFFMTTYPIGPHRTRIGPHRYDYLPHRPQ